MKLRLGSAWWTLKFTDRLTANHGYCDYETQTISIDANLGERDALETLLHECLHATHPELTEKEVTRTASQLAKAMLKTGWHRGRK